MGELRQSKPRFRREGEPDRIELTDDDTRILRHVHRHRFIRAKDLFRLLPDRSPDKLSRRLMRLYRARYLDRPVAQIDRFGAGGSKSLVYGLDNAGARHLKEACGVAIGATDWRARNRSYARESLDHTLAITRFMVDLEIAAAATPGVELILFDEILAGAPEATRRLPQPGRWPVQLAWHGSRAEAYVVPDAIFGLRALGPMGKPVRTFVFLEIDRGTMTIAPAKRVRESDAFLYRASMLRKFLTYAESHRQGLPNAHLGIPAARVLTITTSTSRANAMRQVARDLVVRPGKVPSGLLLFGAQESTINPLVAEYLNADGAAVKLLRR